MGLTLLATVLLFASPKASHACAVCGAADKTLPAKGEEVAFAGRARVTLDGRAAGFAARYTELRVTEMRLEPGVAFALSEDVLLSADVPVLRRTLDRGRVWEPGAGSQGDRAASGPREEHVVLGDASARVSYLATRSRVTRLSLFGGLKAPTAPLERDPSTGAFIPTDLQPGCGAIVPSIGATYTWTISPLISTWASASFLMPVSVRSGPHPGDSLRGSITMQLQPAQVFAARASVHARLDQSGSIDGGMSDGQSGGGALFVAPELVASPVGDLVISAGASFPALQSTRGHRVTTPIALVGIGYDF